MKETLENLDAEPLVGKGLVHRRTDQTKVAKYKKLFLGRAVFKINHRSPKIIPKDEELVSPRTPLSAKSKMNQMNPFDFEGFDE